MAAGNRPGGLTALAVLNFVFGGFGLIGVLGMFAMLKLADTLAAQASEAERAVFEAFQQLGSGMFMALIALSLATSVLLIASGIGYLKLKKTLGRTLGNVYAISALVSGIASAMVMPAELGGGFNLSTLVGFVYPAITLGLLNTAFKEDFVN